MTDSGEETEAIKRERRWMPLILSIGLCPGLGQWVQKRRVMGVLYLVAFLGFFVLTMSAIFRTFAQTIEFVRGNRMEPADFNWVAILGNFGMCIVVYAMNVLDVWLVERYRKNKRDA